MCTPFPEVSCGTFKVSLQCLVCSSPHRRYVFFHPLLHQHLTIWNHFRTAYHSLSEPSLGVQLQQLYQMDACVLLVAVAIAAVSAHTVKRSKGSLLSAKKIKIKTIIHFQIVDFGPAGLTLLCSIWTDLSRRVAHSLAVILFNIELPRQHGEIYTLDEASPPKGMQGLGFEQKCHCAPRSYMIFCRGILYRP